MSQKTFAQEFRAVADKYITGPQAKGLCQMMAQNAFLTEHRTREIEAGQRIYTSFSVIIAEARKHVLEMRELAEQSVKTDREEMMEDVEQEASGVA